MQGFKITASQKNLKATINVPASKSLSNRALILQQVISQLTHDHLVIKNCSPADDTLIMAAALQTLHGQVDVKNAGTCMRFLAAYYAATPGANIILLCSERMKQRPVVPLVQALRQLGANISYIEKEGYAPLHIKGQVLQGGAITLAASHSSQFASALMMTAPLMIEPLHISLEPNATSVDYIHMTADLMQSLGFDISVRTHPGIEITVGKGLLGLNQKIYTVEPDWSSAAFIYQAAALAESAHITIPRLSLHTLQGDKMIAEVMKWLGVNTVEYDDCIVIEKSADPIQVEPTTIDLRNHPDLAPPLVTTAAALGIPYTFTGLESLIIKESNRLQALHDELNKLGYAVALVGSGSLEIGEPKSMGNVHNVLIHTYDDHRLAMCFGLLSLKHDYINLSKIESVAKSYPGFWIEMGKAGINIH